MPSLLCAQQDHTNCFNTHSQMHISTLDHKNFGLYPSSKAIAYRGLLSPNAKFTNTTSPRKRDDNNNNDNNNNDNDNIQLVKRLGSGGFGTVYLAFWKSEKLAVKILHRKRRNSSAITESIKAERRVLEFDHPNIVKTLTVQSFSPGFESGLILMEYVGHRNLLDVINSSNENLGFIRRIRFSLHISKALEYIHSNKVVHLDLKPANIIVTNDDVCKLCDFGCSQHLKQPVSYMGKPVLTGTVAYVAPELFKGALPTEKSDVYSFGVTLWQMLSRDIPFTQENQHVVIFGVVAYNLRPKETVQRKDSKDDQYRRLYRQCWSADPHDRPFFDHLVQVFQIWIKG